MRFPTPVSSSTPSRPAARKRRGLPVFVLIVLAIVLAAATAVLGHDAGLVALGLSTATLFAAAVMQLRAQWMVIIDEALTPTERPQPISTTERLRRLRDGYLSAVDAALDEGDTDRARELADAYSDEALRVITG